ncbi:MAG: DUF4380 domain-containing protein [Armatimonadetes bacterium]|nr:DUF4380 domain-containing protein [Armatimonadota bacterium]
MEVEKTTFSHYGKCLKLSNGVVELFVTTDLGPRIICYRFIGETNILRELGPEAVVKHDAGEWHPWGGHRFWHAPEVLPRSYWPDNAPVDAEILGGDTVRVTAPMESGPQVRKELTIKLDPTGTRVTISHKLTNHNIWPIEVAPWALTIMNSGGVTICPQEPIVSHDDSLLPARTLALWAFTNLADPRLSLGRKYIRLSTDANINEPNKIGVANKQGWAAYLRQGTLFVKRFPYIERANYPDLGCNFENYTEGEFLEVETLGPLETLDPGESLTHVENWFLFKGVDPGDSEDSLDAAITPLIGQTVKE